MSKQDKTIRVRFAPSPTGYMHMGNLRAALYNYLFAQQHNGQFLIRIEDTDQSRNIADGVEQIKNDLAWVGLDQYEEIVLQSEQGDHHEKALKTLEESGKIYRCFCTPERLASVREQQKQAGLPPRYDEHCRDITSDFETGSRRAPGSRGDTGAFIWRLKRDKTKVYQVETLERGVISFDMAHYYDAPLTRSDGSVTFLFANCVDDITMGITHVIRGEDHLSNTGMQVALYDALGAEQPAFGHLPLLCNTDGKKMSKRDFGFSLKDIQAEGIIPNALLHYLGTIGGKTIDYSLSRRDLISQVIISDRMRGGRITYDVAQLKHVNKVYLLEEDPDDIVTLLKNYRPEYQWDTAHNRIGDWGKLVNLLQEEGETLCEYITVLDTLVARPVCEYSEMLAQADGNREVLEQLLDLVRTELTGDTAEELFDQFGLVKKQARTAGVGMRTLMSTVRYLLTGSFQGIGVGLLLTTLKPDEIIKRLA